MDTEQTKENIFTYNFFPVCLGSGREGLKEVQ